MNNSLPRTSPEMQGISSAAILAFVEAAEQQIHELHSFMLLRHGCVVAEGWWQPYRADLPHMLFSLSKSFTSSAIGMAVEEGRLSVDDKVIAFFPDETPADVSDNLAAMRIRDLLIMGTGHAQDTTDHVRAREDGDWIRAFLELPVEFAPGTHFVYNSGATYMLSAIIQRVTGMTLLDYLRPRLLDPLGIEGATWEMSPQGIHTGGWGLKIKTEDIARFGQLYLQGGFWRGALILPETWITQATSKQIDNGSDPNNDWNQGYGYQFWRCRHGAYRGDGAFGQFCIVMPEQDAVLAITSGVTDMGAVMNLVWGCLLPAMGTVRLAPEPEAQDALTRKLVSLELPPQSGRASTPTAANVSGRTYRADDNPVVKSVAVEFGSAQAVVTLTTVDGEHRVECGYSAWQPSPGIEGLFPFESPALASGAWTDDETFTLMTRLYETPFYQMMRLHFTDAGLDLELNMNVGPFKDPITVHLD